MWISHSSGRRTRPARTSARQPHRTQGSALPAARARPRSTPRPAGQDVAPGRARSGQSSERGCPGTGAGHHPPDPEAGPRDAPTRGTNPPTYRTPRRQRAPGRPRAGRAADARDTGPTTRGARRRGDAQDARQRRAGRAGAAARGTPGRPGRRRPGVRGAESANPPARQPWSNRGRAGGHSRQVSPTTVHSRPWPPRGGACARLPTQSPAHARRAAVSAGVRP